MDDCRTDEMPVQDGERAGVDATTRILLCMVSRWIQKCVQVTSMTLRLR
jgi:hypothetical protein